MARIKGFFLKTAGFLFLGLGGVGLFLPVWPTTPFVLLAAGCFSGSPRLRAQILRVPMFREYLENYQKKQGLSPKTVAASLAFLWGMLGISILLVETLWVRLLLGAIGGAVTVHILWMARKRTPLTTDN